MNKEQIKGIMSIIRPAIYALYGRQQLRLDGYAMLRFEYPDVDLGPPIIKDGWFYVNGDKDFLDFNYVICIENFKVTHLRIRDDNETTNYST